MLFLLFQGDAAEAFEPDPINAQIFLTNGRRMELVDVQIRGQDPYSFNFHEDNGYSFISLLRLKRMTRLDASRYELLFDDGSKRIGRISSFNIAGKSNDDRGELQTHNIRVVARMHIIAGPQLRSCIQGHYEKHTPYPYCPVCGQLLQIGPTDQQRGDVQISVPRHHLLRSDPRDQ